MGIWERFRRRTAGSSEERLERKPFQPRYRKECRFIWRNYVPEQGQSNVLQGELLRQLEKLRYEAQNNGNINWDEDFQHFCGFLEEGICSRPIYTKEEKGEIQGILSRFRECGEYAVRFYDGQIPDEEFDPERLACVDDDPYNRIADAIGRLQALHPEPIPFTPDPRVIR